MNINDAIKVLIDVGKDKLEDIETGVLDGIYDDPCIEEVTQIESAIERLAQCIK